MMGIGAWFKGTIVKGYNSITGTAFNEGANNEIRAVDVNVVDQPDMGAISKNTDSIKSYETPITWGSSSIVTLTTPGTKVQLSSSSSPCDIVMIQAKESNINAVTIGGTDVLGGSTGLVNRKGIITLYPTQSIPLSVANLNLLYLDGLTANDSVVITPGTRS